jgi:hypothetical protein
MRPWPRTVDAQHNGQRGRMSTARSLLAATLLECIGLLFMFVIGCASMRAGIEPPVETTSPPAVVEPAASPPIGPPPGYVKPENYWVREKIILTSEPAPPTSATQKSSLKKGKKPKQTG